MKICLWRGKNEEGKKERKDSFAFSLHEIQGAKFQAFFLSCRRQFQLFDHSGQEQGLSFDVLVLQVNILSTLENSDFLYSGRSFWFFTEAKRQERSNPPRSAGFLLCSPLSLLRCASSGGCWGGLERLSQPEAESLLSRIPKFVVL